MTQRFLVNKTWKTLAQINEEREAKEKALQKETAKPVKKQVEKTKQTNKTNK